MLFESSSVSLDSDSGNVWWYHSELTYSTEVVDGIAGIHSANEGVSNVPVNLTKNIVQWVPFGPVDVVHLENCFREYQKEKELVADDGTGNVNNKAGRDGNCGKCFFDLATGKSLFSRARALRRIQMPKKVCRRQAGFVPVFEG